MSLGNVPERPSGVQQVCGVEVVLTMEILVSLVEFFGREPLEVAVAVDIEGIPKTLTSAALDAFSSHLLPDGTQNEDCLLHSEGLQEVG